MMPPRRVQVGDRGPFGWHTVEANPTGPFITLTLEWHGSKDSLTMPANRTADLRRALEALIATAVEWQEEPQ